GGTYKAPWTTNAMGSHGDCRQECPLRLKRTLRLGRIAGRERDYGTQATARGGLERHRGAVPVRDGLHDGKAQARTALAGTHAAVEAIEGALAIAGGEPRAAIRDDQARAGPARADLDLHLAAFRRVAHGVV